MPPRFNIISITPADRGKIVEVEVNKVSGPLNLIPQSARETRARAASLYITGVIDSVSSMPRRQSVRLTEVVSGPEETDPSTSFPSRGSEIYEILVLESDA